MSDSAIDKIKVKNQILHLLKTGGPQTATALAEQLQVSPMAIRQHLQSLQADEWVIYQEERRPVGRPVKLWQLAQGAAKLFPDSHAGLTVSLLQGIEHIFGTTGLEALLVDRAQQQLQLYSAQMNNGWNWRERVAALAQIRSREGYMAEVIEQADNSILLVENHCSIHAAAQHCQQFCRSELDVFTALLGADVSVERVEHVMKGDRRCAYRIFPKAS
ncbi:transcriptional regulator [Oculatella sp. LEGE 06141]|uniref:helix-turn-helix transcriptional regulator n=1 Tax=Oculatella sp. LEGE 06141 TaxID=1828648 RepID=UPI0018827391|nr:metalloregulator ArsR/SmtB family transcription factor [Oculatella sp. LEGE 06141]MBE9179981.1 transcriptional regulator [Oculatella sp. LEGE 06141]